MNIHISSRAEALDEHGSTGVGFATFDSRLLDQKGGNDAMDHLQHGPEQLRMSGQEDAQRDRKR